MPNIIKDGALVDDSWVLVSSTDISDTSALPEGNLILPLGVWQQLKNSLEDRNVGVWLNSDEPPEAIREECRQLPLIAINFPVFGDGRGYSYAHVLRAQYGFDGELRAIGDVLKDQLFYMKRCGFNSFAMREDQKLEEALNHFSDFSKPYQAAADQPHPLFLNR